MSDIKSSWLRVVGPLIVAVVVTDSADAQRPVDALSPLLGCYTLRWGMSADTVHPYSELPQSVELTKILSRSLAPITTIPRPHSRHESGGRVSECHLASARNR